jgi:glycosyltransferase involved in cell wall biosynthesis
VERRCIGQADAVMTVSGGIARLLAERYGIPEPEVLMNVPHAPAAAAGEPVDLRGELGLGGTRIVLYLGGIQQLRGLDVMIRAIAERDDLALVMMGPGSDAYKRELEGLAAGAGVAGRIRFLPPVPPAEIRRYALGADVGVVMHQGDRYLSYRYALPNKLFDYLHAGLPVVVSDLPELGGVVTANRVGATCDPTSPASIAAAIDRVAGDPELRANVDRAAPLYTWEREQEKLLALAARLT